MNTTARHPAYTPAPAVLTDEEERALARVRKQLAKFGHAAVVQIMPETLRLVLRYVEKLEADRDGEGNAAVVHRGSARSAERRLVDMMARLGPTLKWASEELHCEPTLEAVTTAIAQRRSATNGAGG